VQDILPAVQTMRSRLEEKVAAQLPKYEYERQSYEWHDKNVRAQCKNCGSKAVYQVRSYTPDFFIPNGIIIEVKGRLTTHDRKVLLGTRENNPELDLRIIFDKNNRLYKGAKTRYSDWAERYGFIYSLKGKVPEEWIK